MVWDLHPVLSCLLNHDLWDLMIIRRITARRRSAPAEWQLPHGYGRRDKEKAKGLEIITTRLEPGGGG